MKIRRCIHISSFMVSDYSNIEHFGGFLGVELVRVCFFSFWFCWR